MRREAASRGRALRFPAAGTAGLSQGAKNGDCGPAGHAHRKARRVTQVARRSNRATRGYCGTVVWGLAAFVLLWLPCTAPAQAQAQVMAEDRARITRLLQDASRALQGGSAISFLSFFDRDLFSDYLRLESHVVALTGQADVASSIEIGEFDTDGDVFKVAIDWLLQIKLRGAPGPLERRRQAVSLRLERIKKKWRIVQLAPVDFFRSP